MEQNSCATGMNPLYRWKFWRFFSDPTDNPCLLKESQDYFKTEDACIKDAQIHYNAMAFPYTVVMSVICEPKVKYPCFKTVESRRNTFANWPPCMPFSSSEMSDAGFFYTGYHDKVICYSCGKALFRWNPTDHPWEEHEKHSPLCNYLRMYATSIKPSYDGM